MAYVSYNFNSFGLDISDLSIKAVELKKQRGKIYVNAWGETKLKDGVFEKGRIKNKKECVESIKRLLNTSTQRITKKYVIACLPETKSYIKLIQAPKNLLVGKKSPEEQRNEILKLLPQHIPIPPEEARFDWQIMPGDDSNSDTINIIIGAVPNFIVEEYTELIKESGLRPIALEIEAQAITRALYDQIDTRTASHYTYLSNILTMFKKYRKKVTRDLNNAQKIDKAKYEKKLPAKTTRTELAIDLGETRTSLILWSNGMIKFTTSNELSGRQITSMISEKMNLSKSDAEKTKKICGLDPKRCKGEIAIIAEKSITYLAQSIKQTNEFYQTRFSQATPIEHITLCGGGANLKNLPEIITKKTGIPASIGNPYTHIDDISTSKIKPLPEERRQSFTTAIGLALRGKTEI